MAQHTTHEVARFFCCIYSYRGGQPSPASALEASQEALEQVLLHLKESQLDCSNPLMMDGFNRWLEVWMAWRRKKEGWMEDE